MTVKIRHNPEKKGWVRKQRFFKKLKGLMEEYKQVIIVTADYVGSNQMQKIRIALRDNAVLLMGKNTLMKKALCDCRTLNHHPNLQNLMDVIKGNVGLVFTNGDTKEVKKIIEKFKTFVPARAGLVAPCDVVIPSGTTSLEPSTTSFFQALNIPTKIKKGAVEIIGAVDLIKKGEKVGNSEAALLAKLNVKPFSYNLVIKQIYDDESGSVYPPEILDITEDYVAERFAMGVTNISAIALSLSYPSLSALPYMIVNGYKNVLAIALLTNYTLAKYHKEQNLVPVAAPAIPGTSMVDDPSEEQAMSHDVGKPKPKLPSSLVLERLQEEKDRERQSQVASVTHPKDVDCDEYKEDDTPDNHLLVQPMYQIFSITIDRAELRGSLYPKMYKITSLDDGVSCQIFGLVRVFVQNGKKIDIYNRSKDNPEFVKLGGLLSIRGCPILQLGAIKVAIYLYDLAHDLEIVNEIIEVECDCIDDYDQVLVKLAHGAYGVATIHHSTLQHAVSANIENMVLKQVSDSDSGTDAHARLRGTVSAHFERSYAISTSDVQEYPSLILFDNREKTTEYVQFGTPINLFTTCVGVPAFYSLEIRANFEDESGRDVSTNAKLSIMHEGSAEKCGKGPNCEMKLLVKWSSMLDAAPTHPNLHICVSEAEQRLPNIASVNPIVFPCVEVFSITICPDNRDTNVRGLVKIKDSSHTFLVFNDKQSWYNGESLNLKAPLFSFDDEPFKVDISLVDEDERVISKGSFEWDCRDYKNDAPMFHDRFLCSIIQGDIGYAAVHYSMITYAVQANMQVLVSSQCNPASVFRVHGSITAKYGSYDYSCPYNQEYCKSTLFSKPKEDDVPCEIGLARSKYKLPLAKSIIAVPLDDLLIINLSLTVIGPGQKVQELDQVVEFKTDGRSSCLILGDGYEIRVRANWNYLRKYPGN